MATTDSVEVSNSEVLLSTRGKHVLSTQSGDIKYLRAAHDNSFHPRDNPQGIANFGRSTNQLMDKEIEERLTKSDLFRFESSKHQHYFNFQGSFPLRESIAKFYGKFFNIAEEVYAEDLSVLSGAASCLDALSHLLFDPGDLYLTPVPTYGRIFTNFNDRSLAQPCPLQLSEEPNSEGIQFALTPETLEEGILALRKEGKPIRGFVLINPQNPLGDVYPPQLVRSLLEVCARYELHVIVDEVYVLSLTDKNARVASVLSIPDLPDPQRTHAVWALTKDFGLAGLRVGVIHTRNKAVTRALRSLCIYSPTASIIQDVATTILRDTDWLENVFMPTYRERLHNQYKFMKNRLEQIGVKVRRSQAGLFVWVNCGQFLPSQTKQGERELFEELFEGGVYVTPGSWLHCESPGWFRLVFTMQMEELEIGLERLERVLIKKNRTG